MLDPICKWGKNARKRLIFQTSNHDITVPQIITYFPPSSSIEPRSAQYSNRVLVLVSLSSHHFSLSLRMYAILFYSWTIRCSEIMCAKFTNLRWISLDYKLRILGFIFSFVCLGFDMGSNCLSFYCSDMRAVINHCACYDVWLPRKFQRNVPNSEFHSLFLPFSP